MKSEKDGVKKYPKGLKVNARRKSALSRLEIKLNELKEANLTFLKESKQKQDNPRDNEVFVNLYKECSIEISRIGKEIETLKLRIY